MKPDLARALVRQARETNAQRDASDRAVGFAAPGDTSPDLLLRTAMSALGAAMQTVDWNEVAEGYVMLCDLHKRLTGRDYDPMGSA
jgi:hypothetical protein